MSGLHTVASIGDPYDVVLFVHLCALLGAIASGTLVHLAEARLRVAATLVEVRSPVRMLAGAEKVFPVALAVLLGTGAYLVDRRWTWDSGWVEASLGAVAALLLNGAIVVGGRSRALKRELGLAADGRATGALIDLSRRHFAGVASWLNTGLALGIVFVMTTKPVLGVSLGTLLVAAGIGAVAGLRLRGTGARNG